MNNGEFQKEVIERLSNLESDVSFVIDPRMNSGASAKLC